MRESKENSKHQSFIASSHLRLRNRAFTLVEMVIVVGIIVLLAALTVGITVTVTRKSEIRETENILRLLDMALQDWELSSERQLTWGVNDTSTGYTYDIQSDVSPSEQFRQLLAILRRSSTSHEFIAQIDTDYLVHVGSELTVRDPWDNELGIVHPGRLPNTTLFPEDDRPLFNPDDDGTIRTDSAHYGISVVLEGADEQTLGICQNRRICFFSHGPDTHAGDLQLEEEDPTDIDALRRADDNVYSYELSRERPSP